MSYQHLDIRKDGHIAWVYMNRPEKLNALNHAHLQELEAMALAFREDAETRVVILAGLGRHFSAGADLTDPGEAYDVPMVHRRRRFRMGERAVEAILDMDQITIAAWHGAAVGGGTCLALACDFRVGSEDCFGQLPEIDIGINLMWKSLPLLVNLVGPARAKRMAIGGERIDAATLLAWGVLDHCVPREALEARTLEMAEHYAAKSPIAAQMIKQSTNQIANALNHAIMHMDVDQNMLATSTEDRAAAVKAYFKKEPPTFSGN